MKIKIATALADFGVEYIELTSAAASEQSFEDCRTICQLKKKLGWKTKILTHVRCNMEDAKKAVMTGMSFRDSSLLMTGLYGKKRC